MVIVSFGGGHWLKNWMASGHSDLGNRCFNSVNWAVTFTQ